jgi:hypothetical protein
LRLIFQNIKENNKTCIKKKEEGIPIDCNIFSMALQRFEVMNNAYLGIFFWERKATVIDRDQE